MFKLVLLNLIALIITKYINQEQIIRTQQIHSLENSITDAIFDNQILKELQDFVKDVEGTTLKKIKEKTLQGFKQNTISFFQKKTYCDICINSVQETNQFIAAQNELDKVMPILLKICKKATSKDGDFCTGILNNFASVFLRSLLERYNNPKLICSKIYLCKFQKLESTLEDFKNKIFSDLKKQQIVQKSQNKTLKIVQLTDMHLDLQYQEGTDAICSDSYLCCRQNHNPNITQKAGFWGTSGPCDLPLRTIEQTIKYVFEEIKPDLILWTGDSISHDIEKQNKTNQTYNQGLIAKFIQQYNNGTQIVAIYGNFFQNYFIIQKQILFDLTKDVLKK